MIKWAEEDLYDVIPAKEIIPPNNCIDPRDLNKAIKREHHPMQTIEEVVTRVPNAAIFSILDASSGFWQIKLDQESEKICTFNTPFGRYIFKQLPFGLSSSQNVFQRVMSQMFEDIEGVEVVVDDILVWGENEQQHDSRLNQVLERARHRELKLNKSKCQFRKQQVSYLGHILTNCGLKPDPKKTIAVKNMPTPTNKEDLQRFLGMVTYISKFIPHFSQVASPLRALLEKDAAWQWHHEHEQSLQQLKELATSVPVLAYFKPDRPIKLSVDASSKGLGAVILQDDHPIAYASKSLTKTQQQYAQIEIEMLAVVFGCTRFHDYIYGVNNVTVESDHKPLETILKKPLCQAPLRLQKMIMTIQKYSINVIYRPGKELVLADTLSRAFLQDDNDLIEENFEVNTVRVIPMSDAKIMELKNETKKDNQLQQLISVLQSGWPTNKRDTPEACLPFWNFRDKLSMSDDNIFKGERIVIPKKLQPEMLRHIHSSHLGIEKCKWRARDVLFWPGMTSQIEDTVLNCQICSTYQRENTKEPMLPHIIPEHPWSPLGADLFVFNGNNYLILADYYSSFIELSLLHTTTSQQIIAHLKSQFARHGIPDRLIADNGPQFSSDVFIQFTKDYCFQHCTASPHYPQSNGMAERAVQTVKNCLKKALLDRRDPYLALLEYRNTPMSDDLGSPAQRLMGRRTKTLIPTSAKLLCPKTILPMIVQKELLQRKERQKHYYDQHSKPLQELMTGDQVMMKIKDRWQPAKVIAKTAPRSYIIKTTAGQIYRKNRRHLRKPRHSYIQAESEELPDDDMLISDDQDNNEVSVESGSPQQNLPLSQPTNLRRSKRIRRKPVRYSDSGL